MKIMLSRLFLFIFICAALSAQSYSQVKISDMNAQIPLEPNVKHGVLSNGMAYYILENHKPEKRAEFRLAVRTGSIMEDDDQKGLAHLVEHMCFNGTKNFPKQDLVNYLESIGVRFGNDLNAYTSFDETVYMLQLPTDSLVQFNRGLQVLEDWAHNVSFEDVEIDKERGVVLEEWRLGKGADDRIWHKQLPVLYYKSHYADRDVIGDTLVINHATHETVRRFYKDWYRPDMMAIIAVGDFNASDIEKKIRDHFENIPPVAYARQRIKFPVPDNEKVLVSVEKDKELGFPTVSLYFKHPERKSKTYADFRQSLKSELFSGMLDKRLDEQKQKPGCPFLYSYTYDGQLAGDKWAFTMWMYAKGDAILKSFEAQLTEAYRVMQHGFTPTEFERQKLEMIKRAEKAFKEKDKTESDRLIWPLVSNYLDSVSYPGPEYRYELYKTLLPGIKLDEVNALSNQLIKKDNVVALLSVPDKEGIQVPTKEEVLAAFDRIGSMKLEPYKDIVSNKPLFDKKLNPGKVAKEITLGKIGVTQWELSNGVRVILKPTNFKNDEILFDAYSYGGSSLYDDKDFVNAQICDEVVDKCGLGDFDLNTLTKLLTGKIVSVSPFISALNEGIRGNCSPDDMETMFQLINMYFTQPRKDQEAFASLIQEKKADIRNWQNDPESNFSDSVTVTFNQYHPRMMPYTEQTFDNVSLDRAIDIYRERFSNAGDFTFFFVGNFDNDKIKPFIEKYLGSLPSNGKKENWKDVGIRHPKGVVNKHILKGIEPKSSVELIFPNDFKWTRENRYNVSSLIEVMDIKLREAIREDKSGTYGIYAYPRIQHYPVQECNLFIGFGCNPARVDELVGAVVDQIKDVQKNKPDEKYITKVKEMQTRERQVSLKENRYWLSQLYTYYFNNDDPLLIPDYEKLIDNLKAEDIQNAAKTYFNLGNYEQYVLYPKKAE